MTDLGVAPGTSQCIVDVVTHAYLVKSPTYSVLLSYISVNLILFLFSNRLFYILIFIHFLWNSLSNLECLNPI